MDEKVTYRETECKPTGFVVGLDLGQAADYTALVVNERTEGQVVTMRQKPWQPEPVDSGYRPLIKHRIRYIHRYPLGVVYPDIVASVRSILAQLPVLRDKAELWIDSTGVGKAVFDIFVAAGLRPVGVSITAGNAVNRVSSTDVRIPKRDLASTLQAVLQTERLAIARELPFSSVLEDELSNFRVKVAAGGNETFEGRSGVHDDLVLSLAISVWAAEKRCTGPGSAILELARRELRGMHGGDPPTPIERTFAPGSVEYAQQQARIAAESQ